MYGLAFTVFVLVGTAVLIMLCAYVAARMADDANERMYKKLLAEREEREGRRN